VRVETSGDLRSWREVGWGSPCRLLTCSWLPPGCCCVDSGMLLLLFGGPAGSGQTRTARILPGGEAAKRRSH
jgi:hypothetical protein